MNTRQCLSCGENNNLKARFCSACGAKIEIRSGKPPQGTRSLKSKNYWLLISAGALLLAFGIWGGFLKPSPPEIPLSEGAAQPGDSNLPYPEVERAPVGEVKAAWEEGNALIIDVRSQSEYLEGHIEGAISLPLSELADRYSELPADRLIYLYCT